VFGLVRVTQAFLPLIRQAQGRIINLGSVGGKMAVPFYGALSASKYALEAINDTLRLELSPWGIHVILYAAASISTPAVDHLVAESETAIQRFSPEGRQRYERSLRNFVETTVKSEKAGSPPEVVAQVVLKALTAKKPKARYPVGKNSRILTLIPQLLTAPQLDLVRFRLFGLPQDFGAWVDPGQSKLAQGMPSQQGVSHCP
jgi:NAD(P)-dependent dehydrogenase (short-subunit alcohol dehydrogenase family)